MKKWTTFVLVAATGVAVILTIQLRTVRMANASLESEIRGYEVKQLILSQGIVRNVRADLENAEIRLLGDEPNRIYMVVDTKCRACRTALESLATVSQHRVIYLTSFHDLPSDLSSWVSGFEGDFRVVDVDPTNTILARLALDATPVYLEYSLGQPTNLYLGAPPEHWVQGDAERSGLAAENP